MPTTLTYLIPSVHQASGSWLKSIFSDASRYSIQSKTPDTLVVAATAASGMAGYTVVLKGTFGDYWDVGSQTITSAELRTPGGTAASVYKHTSNFSIGSMGGGLLRGDVIGSSGADTLNAALLDFTIDGGPGNDLIRSGNYYPTPSIRGGPGDDTIVGSVQSEWIIAGDGGDWIDGGGGFDDAVLFDEATGPVHVWLGQPAPAGQIRIDNITRLLEAPHGLIIHGNPLGYSASGVDGPDTLIGGAGADGLTGWYGNDLLLGDAGDDSLRGDPGNDTLVGGAGRDQLMTSWGDDSADGGDGEDFIRGEEGNDYLRGGAAFDDMHGNMGQDTLYGEAGHDWVVGGQGADLLHGDADNDLMYGNMAADTMYGDAGNDTLRGGQEGDTMSGGDGADWLFGDRGDDTMSGGSGADVFFVTPESGTDRIIDFNSAQGDRIAFEGDRVGYTLSFEGGDAVIAWDGGAKMVLVGVTSATLGTWLLG